jgi:hypothetical protein
VQQEPTDQDNAGHPGVEDDSVHETLTDTGEKVAEKVIHEVEAGVVKAWHKVVGS